ncbi:unnamed protein product [Phytophthora lilii]|uniref:Unnamed protein product n=1 Tax=Phytophthora lilii TaxID=2077276 RepID=A0A9W6U0P6_9STRA|nr:unnamed protein product [Phytophthora lilii]
MAATLQQQQQQQVSPPQQQQVDAVPAPDTREYRAEGITMPKLGQRLEDMSDIDKVMHFQKGLLVEIRQEVKLRQFRNRTDAILLALMYDRTHSVNTRRQGKDSSRAPALLPPRESVEEPTPMEIGSSQFVARAECMRNHLCFYCKEPGHRLSSCRKRQIRNASRGSTTRVRGQPSFSAHQSTFRRVVEDDGDDDSSDEVEVMQSMQLNMVAARVTSSASGSRGRLDGVMNRRPVKILVNSGAEQKIVRPGLACHFVDAAKVTAERFDGTTTPSRVAQRCLETLTFGGRDFKNVSLIEWEVSAHQDVIIGHPWLVQFNPSINWQTGEVQFRKQRTVCEYRSLNTGVKVPEPAIGAIKVKLEFLQYPLPATLRQQLDAHVKAGRCKSMGALKHVTVKTSPKVKKVPPQLQEMLDEYADVFPDELPPELPPHRSIKHEVVLKPGAKPSNRAPFRLSKVEQAALELFVADLLKNNWIQVSDSPWVSNIFAVPKKDPTTGKLPLRLEWLRSADPHMPIRWVIDCRLVNAASDVAKIPLPHIEELFDQMEGAVVFSILDLASGYHQMRMSPTSKQYTAFHSNHEIYEWNVANGPFCVLWRTTLSICVKFAKCFVPTNCTPAPTSVTLFRVQLTSWVTPFLVRGSMSTPQNSCHRGMAGTYSIVKKNVDWVWDEPQRCAFNSIKLALQQAPVLRLPDFDRPFIVTTDASHDCVGGVLSQMHDGHDLPVAFYSKKLGVHELNWPVHEKNFSLSSKRSQGGALLAWNPFRRCHKQLGVQMVFAAPSGLGPTCSVARRLGIIRLQAASPPRFSECGRRRTFPAAGGLSSARGGDDDAVTAISVCAPRFTCSTCSTVRKSSARRMTTTDQNISSRDQAVMLSTKHPASPVRAVGALQTQIQLNATAVDTTTTVSSIELDRATKKTYQKAYAGDPVYKKLWRTNSGSHLPQK